jgi:hypothetical protein
MTEANGELQVHDISHELWREYDFAGRVYRIVAPRVLYTHPGGTTHRVVDGEGVAHCLPAPGHCGCVVRWQDKAGGPPVRF